MSKFDKYIDADANYKTVNSYFNPNGEGAKLKCNYSTEKNSKCLNLSFWWDSSDMYNLYENTRETLGKYLAKATTHHLNDILTTAIKYAYDDRNTALSDSKDEALEILKYIKDQEMEIYGK